GRRRPRLRLHRRTPPQELGQRRSAEDRAQRPALALQDRRARGRRRVERDRGRPQGEPRPEGQEVGMSSELLLAAWTSLPENEQRTILEALQALADAEAAKTAGSDRITKAPLVDIVAANRDGTDVVLRSFHDYRI